jgi:hypothetical protein
MLYLVQGRHVLTFVSQVTPRYVCEHYSSSQISTDTEKKIHITKHKHTRLPCKRIKERRQKDFVGTNFTFQPTSFI